MVVVVMIVMVVVVVMMIVVCSGGDGGGDGCIDSVGDCNGCGRGDCGGDGDDGVNIIGAAAGIRRGLTLTIIVNNSILLSQPLVWRR